MQTTIAIVSEALLICIGRHFGTAIVSVRHLVFVEFRHFGYERPPFLFAILIPLKLCNSNTNERMNQT
jgi:hypothetical protein